MNALPATIYISFGGALLSLLAGRRSASAARWCALAAAVAGWGAALLAARSFVPAPGLRTLVDVAWIPAIGARYHLAADGISLALAVLTGLAATAGVLFSWNVEERAGEFFACFLAIVGGVYGVFLSADALLLFAFYEIAIVPKYFLIAIWGSANREYAAMKLVLYSFAGSALVLAGLLWAYSAGGGRSFGLEDLAAAAAGFRPAEQIGMFAAVFFGFAVLAGLFPFHTWAPTGHAAAPTAGSMLLAGIVMKVGAYGCLRVAMPLFPAGFAFWQPAIAWLAAGGIVYAALIALVQDDLKLVIGYSSVSHMGFVLLGLAAANVRGISGAVVQMFSHGLIAGLLFAVAGRMIYARLHTRRLADLRAMSLYRLLPFAAGTFVLAGVASMGLPGFSGFPAELSVLMGAWSVSPAWAAVAALGIVVVAAFTLRAIQLSFFGQTGPAEPAGAVAVLPPISFPERAGTVLLLGAIVAVGLKPDWLFRWVETALQSPFMHAALK